MEGYRLHRHRNPASFPLSTKFKEPLYSVINTTKSISTMSQSNLETLRSWEPMVESGRRCFQISHHFTGSKLLVVPEASSRLFCMYRETIERPLPQLLNHQGCTSRGVWGISHCGALAQYSQAHVTGASPQGPNIGSQGSPWVPTSRDDSQNVCFQVW